MTARGSHGRLSAGYGTRGHHTRSLSSVSVTATADAAAIDFDRAYKELCHLVALTTTGKSRRVVESLIETVLALTPGGLPDQEAIGAAIGRRMCVEPSQDDLSQALSTLLVQGRVARLGANLQLSATAAAEVRANIERDRQLTSDVTAQWIARASSEPELQTVPPGDLWRALSGYLQRVFRQHGALALQLIGAEVGAGEPDDAALAVMLEEAAGAAGLAAVDAFKRSVRAFCADPSPELRRYLSKSLDATFTFFVLRTPQAAGHYLRDRLAPLRLFLDTNVLFEIFGLHDEMGAAAELLDFIRGADFPFELFVHERSVREFKQTLNGCEDRITARRFTPALSRAALTAELHAIDRRYHELNSVSLTDPQAFIARYSDVRELLKGQGIRIWSDDTDDVMAKGELINRYQDFLAERRPDGPKGYNVLDHDMEVWLSLKRQRHDGPTALDTGALLLTNDTWLYRFDWRELRDGGPGIAVLPAQLMAVLRPFARVRADYDRRFLTSLAVPEFYFASVDFADTTQRVLSYLAAFSDLPAETAASVLRNDLLLTRLKNVSEDSDEFRDVIESAVLAENSRLVEETGALQTRLSELNTELAQTRRETEERVLSHQKRITTLTSQLATAQRDTKVATDALATAEAEARKTAEAEKQQWRTEVSDLRSVVDQLQAADARRKQRTRRVLRATVVVFAVALILAVALVPDVAGWNAITQAPHRRRIQALLGIALAGGCYVGVGPRHHRAWVGGAVVVTAALTVITLFGP